MEAELAIIATIIVSLLSLVGLVVVKQSKGLIAMAGGTLIFGAIIHLLPEANEELQIIKTIVGAGSGFLIFFLLEKGLKWRHCHEEPDCPKHHFGIMNLAGDGIHNLIDGIVIGGAFGVSKETGLATTFMVILHEIPQEIADFGVLRYSGFSERKALGLNLIIGLIAVLGAVVGQRVGQEYLPWLMAITAGGFVYIGLVDLVPEIIKKRISWLWFGLGAGLMFLGRLVE